jgi:hypothetical protein
MDDLVNKGDFGLMTIKYNVEETITSYKIIHIDYKVKTRTFFCKFASELIMTMTLNALKNAGRERFWNVFIGINSVDRSIGGFLFEMFVRYYLKSGFRGKIIPLNKIEDVNVRSFSDITIPNCILKLFQHKRCGGIELFLDNTESNLFGSLLSSTESYLYIPNGRFCPTIADVIILPSKSSCDVIFVQSRVGNDHEISAKGFFSMLMLVKLISTKYDVVNVFFFFFLIGNDISIFKCPLSSLLQLLFKNIEIFVVAVDDPENKKNNSNLIDISSLSKKTNNPSIKLELDFFEKIKNLQNSLFANRISINTVQEIYNYYSSIDIKPLVTVTFNANVPVLSEISDKQQHSLMSVDARHLSKGITYNASVSVSNKISDKKNKVPSSILIELFSFSAPPARQIPFINIKFCFKTTFFHRVPVFTWGDIKSTSFFDHMIQLKLTINKLNGVIKKEEIDSSQFGDVNNMRLISDNLLLAKEMNLNIHPNDAKSGNFLLNKAFNSANNLSWYEVYLFYHTAFFKTKEKQKKRTKKIKPKGVFNLSAIQSISVDVELPFSNFFYNKFEICELLASWRILFSGLELLFENEKYYYLRIKLKLAHAKSLITMFVKMGGTMDTVIDTKEVSLSRRHFININLSNLSEN